MRVPGDEPCPVRASWQSRAWENVPGSPVEGIQLLGLVGEERALPLGKGGKSRRLIPALLS